MKKGKMLFAAVLSALACVAVLPMGQKKAEAAAVTEVEPNNSFEEALLINLGDSVSGKSVFEKTEIVSADHDDYYKIILTEEGKLNIELTAKVTSRYNHYACIDLYNADTDKIYSYDKDENSNTGTVDMELPLYLTSGIYYLVYHGYNDSEYSFSTSFETSGCTYDEPNDVISQASSYEIGTLIKGQLGINDRNDNYKFTLSKEGRISVKMIAYMRWHRLSLYDINGNSLWSASREWNESTGFCSDSYNLDLPAGTYYFNVTNDTTGSAGTYTLETSFTDSEVNILEPNDSIAGAKELVLGTAANGQLGLNDKDDFYKISLEKEGRISFKMTAYMPSHRIYIFDQNSDRVWSSSASWNETTGFSSNNYDVDLLAGTYFVQVTNDETSDSTRTGRYCLETAYTEAGSNISEPNNSFAEAKDIKLAEEVKGQIAANDLYDIYKFTLNNAQKIDIGITAYMAYYNLFLHDMEGKQIGDVKYNSRQEDAVSVSGIHTEELSAGTYFVKVMGCNSTSYSTDYPTGNYSFVISKHTEEKVPDNSTAGDNTVVEDTDSETVAQQPVQKAKPKMSRQTLTLKKGKSTYLSVENATGKIKWKSANKKIASVTSSGLVTAKKKGKTVIMAKANGKTVKCKITVKK